jgi:hypothetical protein
LADGGRQKIEQVRRNQADRADLIAGQIARQSVQVNAKLSRVERR